MLEDEGRCQDVKVWEEEGRKAESMGGEERERGEEDGSKKRGVEEGGEIETIRGEVDKEGPGVEG